MRKALVIMVLALVGLAQAWGRTRAAGWCTQGGQTILVGGQTSSTSTTVMRSYPACTVTVYNTGTLVLATLYSDDFGTPLANPFTAGITGYWFFYADNARFDVALSGGGIPTPFSMADIPLGGVLTLNGLTGDAQTFTNDTNVTIASAGSAHVLGWAGTLGVPRGGLGVGTLAANGVLLGNTVAAVQATAAGAAFQSLRVPGGGGAPAFGAMALDQAAAVTGALAIANGGTGQAAQTAGFDALAPTTAKGDLIVHDGADNLRLGVGTDDYVLMADAAQPTGVKWGQVDLATGVTGVLPISSGGTGQTTQLAAMDALSPTWVKGDILVDNGVNVVRRGIGTDNYVLMANAAQADGLLWSNINLSTTSVTGVLPVVRGGSGLAAGTSGGILGFTAAGTMASSVALPANQLVLGGGAGATPVPLGALGTTTTLLHGNAAGPPAFGAVALAADVAGVLPIANGGTSGATQTAGFDALSPTSVKGDLVIDDGTNAVKLGIGADGQVLTADSSQATGAKWAAPGQVCRKDTVVYTNPAFEVASLTADVTLFTLGQYQKITGITVKHSVQFGDGGGAMTDVSISIGKAASTTFYTYEWSIGEVTAVADTKFLDSAGFTSSTMAAGGEAVLARLTATARDFGDGANTFLTGGGVDVWTCYQSIQ